MKCKLCKKKFIGRTDKVFCSVKCKSIYHRTLASVTDIATMKTDKILHRNRSILLEILGKNKTYKKVDKSILDLKKFNYTFVTAYHINSSNKMINYIYDFSWMIFSDKEIAIRRLQSS